jgi:hypothetical protein
VFCTHSCFYLASFCLYYLCYHLKVIFFLCAENKINSNFEFVEAGAILPTLTLQQLKNVELADSTFAASFATFTAMLFYQFFEIFQLAKSRQLSFLFIFKAALCAADVSVFALVALRGAFLSQAIDHFLLDPKGTPRFAKVFLLQHHFTPLVAMSLFMHTLLLIHILSTLNAVRRKIFNSRFSLNFFLQNTKASSSS